MHPIEHPTVHAVDSSAHGTVSTAHGVDSRIGRGLKGFVQGLLDVGLCGLCKEISRKVAKNARKVKEKKGPSLAHHAVRQQDKPKSEGEGQLCILVGVPGAMGTPAFKISWIGYLPERG